MNRRTLRRIQQGKSRMQRESETEQLMGLILFGFIAAAIIACALLDYFY